jgi:RNA polymerase sigma factor (sigma-70 family)
VEVAGLAEGAGPTLEHDIHEAEHALVRQAVTGDTEARARLVECARRQVHQWCCSLLGDPDRAEDATQEVLVRVWQHIAHLQDARAYPAWLYRITLHVCHQRHGPEPQYGLGDDCVASDASALQPDLIDAAAAHQDLERMLAGLAPADLDVLSMRFASQMSAREIGSTMHISEGAARARLHAIIERLRSGRRKG